MRLFIETKNQPGAPEPIARTDKEWTMQDLIAEFENVRKAIQHSGQMQREFAAVLFALVQARKVDPTVFDTLIPLLWLRELVRWNSQLPRK